MKILYLEDSTMDADLARRSLAKTRAEWGLRVVPTVAEARAVLEREGDFDLLMLDLRLPDGSGVELLATLRAEGNPIPVVMVNLLGDIWRDDEPAWDKLLSQPNVMLHLYGKKSARIGRKMGHFTVTAATLDQALGRATAIEHSLRITGEQHA